MGVGGRAVKKKTFHRVKQLAPCLGGASGRTVASVKTGQEVLRAATIGLWLSGWVLAQNNQAPGYLGHAIGRPGLGGRGPRGWCVRPTVQESRLGDTSRL